MFPCRLVFPTHTPTASADGTTNKNETRPIITPNCSKSRNRTLAQRASCTLVTEQASRAKGKNYRKRALAAITARDETRQPIPTRFCSSPAGIAAQRCPVLLLRSRPCTREHQELSKHASPDAISYQMMQRYILRTNNTKLSLRGKTTGTGRTLLRR